MGLPNNITTITVTGSYDNGQGAPLAGTVIFTPSTDLIDGTGRTIIRAIGIPATLNNAGQFSIVLPCTDNTTINGGLGQWTYTVQEVLNYGNTNASIKTYSILVPSSFGPTVDISELLSPSSSMTQYLLAANNLSDVASTTTAFSNIKQPATSSSTGVIELSGDLGGTATAPQLQNTANVRSIISSVSAVTSVFNRTGAVAAQTGDYTAAQVGAIPASAQGANNGVATLDGSGLIPVAQLPNITPWIFNVKTYGAIGDGVTDDTAAIIRTVNAAFAWGVSSGTYCATVFFPPAVYLLTSAPTAGGSTAGNAQIPIPLNSMYDQKFVLTFKGVSDATGLYSWTQTTPQQAGAVLRTTYDAGSSIPSIGEASVVGGPLPHFLPWTDSHGNSNSWNNVLVVVDGITIEIPQNGNICAWDFGEMAEANLPNASALARSSTAAPAIPTPNWSFGLRMPQTNNNDNSNIGYYSCEGFVYGIIVTEHVQANSIRLINCYDGLVVWPTSGFPHRNIITYASIENCVNCIVFAESAAGKLDLLSADIEWGTGYIVSDPNNGAYGTIGVGSNGSDGGTLSAALSNSSTGVNGGRHLKVINLDQTIGSVAAPSIPASTVAFQNPFWRDAAVSISGGTVTGVAVDGQTQVTSTPCTVYVPSGRTVTLTYSVVPTSWSWILL